MTAVKYAVGDRVRMASDFYASDVHTPAVPVGSLGVVVPDPRGSDLYVNVKFDHDDREWYCQPSEIEPEFYVGQAVRVTKDYSDLVVGDVGTVVKLYPQSGSDTLYALDITVKGKSGDGTATATYYMYLDEVEPAPDLKGVVLPVDQKKRGLVLALTGAARAGKNTVAEMIVELMTAAGWTVRTEGFADRIKVSAATALGFKGDKAACIAFCDRLKTDGTVVRYLHFPRDYTNAEGEELHMLGREFLQLYGTEAHRDIFGTDFWVDQVLPATGQTWSDPDFDLLVITDCRFENEARRAREHGVVWRVDRSGTDWVIKTSSHMSEGGVPDALVDRVIDNRGTLEALRYDVSEALGIQFEIDLDDVAPWPCEGCPADTQTGPCTPQCGDTTCDGAEGSDLVAGAKALQARNDFIVLALEHRNRVRACGYGVYAGATWNGELISEAELDAHQPVFVTCPASHEEIADFWKDAGRPQEAPGAAVGDRVKVLDASASIVNVGDIGEVRDAPRGDGCLTVYFGGDRDYTQVFHPSEIEVVG